MESYGILNATLDRIKGGNLLKAYNTEGEVRGEGGFSTTHWERVMLSVMMSQLTAVQF